MSPEVRSIIQEKTGPLDLRDNSERQPQVPINEPLQDGMTDRCRHGLNNLKTGSD